MKYLIIIISIFLSSCGVHDMNGREFSAKYGEKNVSIKFINKEICLIRQEYSCKSMPNQIKEFSFIANWRLEKLIVEVYKKKKSRKPKRVPIHLIVLDGFRNVKYDISDINKPKGECYGALTLNTMLSMNADTLFIKDNMLFYNNGVVLEEK